MKRTLALLATLAILSACARPPEAPAETISASWTLIVGHFSPTAPVFFARFDDAAGLVTGTISWFDGSYRLSGTHEGARVEITATAAQPPSRTWRFSGTISGNQIVGNVTTDSSVVFAWFLKDVIPP